MSASTPGTLTSGEICRNYKITRGAFAKWRKDPTFPRPLEPVTHGGARPGGVWDAEQIAEWRKRKTDGRRHRRRNAVAAYKRRNGEHGAMTEVAHAYGITVATLRRWLRELDIPTPGERADS